MKAWLPEMVAEAGLPYVTYLILHAQGVSVVASLLAGSVFPIAFIGFHFVRQRRLDGFGLIILGTIAAGAGLALLSGSSRIYLVKESFLTGAFGLAMLGSLFGRRPFMFYSGRKFATDGSPAGLAAWDSYWPKSPTFRRSNRVMTLVWGLTFVAEAAIRVVAAYTLSTSTVVALSAVVPLVIIGLLMFWTFTYAGRTRPRSRAEVVAASTR
jgi:intracellular septation protein A